MRFAILSDTHIVKDLKKMERFIKEDLKDINYIIHAGDFKSYKVYSLIKDHKEIIGVWGNNDGKSLRDILKEKEIIAVNGYKIGLYHGHGEKKNSILNTIEKFKSDDVDIIIFGHSHQPIIKTYNKTLLINPGSITMKRKERWFSYIILTVEKNSIEATIKLY